MYDSGSSKDSDEEKTMNILKVLFLSLMFLIGFFAVSAYPQKTKCVLESVAAPTEDDSKVRSPFRYVIVAGVSRIEKYVNENKESLDLEVLMEDKAFNEDNLRCLFQFLSKRFTERPGLAVYVYTTLDVIDTPEENDHRDLKGPVSKYTRYKHAFYFRNGEKCDERFDYSIPGLLKNKRVYLSKCQSVPRS